MAETENYVYVNGNEDVWVVRDVPKGENPEPTVDVYIGVPDDLVEELEDQGYDLGGDILDKLAPHHKGAF